MKGLKFEYLYNGITSKKCFSSWDGLVDYINMCQKESAFFWNGLREGVVYFTDDIYVCEECKTAHDYPHPLCKKCEFQWLDARNIKGDDKNV